jgi:hypothetical protein
MKAEGWEQLAAETVIVESRVKMKQSQSGCWKMMSGSGADYPPNRPRPERKPECFSLRS